MKTLLVNLVLITSIGLVGCSTNTRNENTGVGAVAGAAVGGVGAGLLGGNPVAIGASIIGGALIGGFIGNSMDSTDNTTGNTVIRSNTTNQTTEWTNSRTGVVYTMTPTSSRFASRGYADCRNFHFTASSNGRTRSSDGVACLMNDGRYHSISR